MGNDLNYCCKNPLIAKLSEKELIIKKKDIRLRKKVDTNTKTKDKSNLDTVNPDLKKHLKEANLKKFNKNDKVLFNANNNEDINKTKTNNLYDEYSKTKILESLIDCSPKLYIKVLNQSCILKKGKILKINCLGLANNLSERNKNDGITYFGIISNKFKEKELDLDIAVDIEDNTSQNIENNISHTEINNTLENINTCDDISKKDISNKSNLGRHFKIEFNINNLSYYISDLGNTYGTFIKINSSLTIKDYYLINIGESYLIANILDKNDANNSGSVNISNLDLSKSIRANTLKLKLITSSNTNNNYIGYNNDIKNYNKTCHNYYYFPPSDSILSIGRFNLSDIQIEDNLLSKIHCTIHYDFTKNAWILIDGNNGKSSTNGTWLFLNTDYEIHDGMIFKHKQTIFQIGKT